jgi:signal recognition particle receptor subunit beta
MRRISMVLFNYSTKELTAKIVYYGPGLCGKTTNLQWIHEKIPIKNKGKMLSLATEADRTLFFDFLPIELGTIRGMKTRIQLYTVPGQVFYNATRRMVLKSADCVVFVVDSQEPMLDPNLDSFQNMRENLEVNEIDPDEIPVVIQYNKRDLPNALPVSVLNQKLNQKGYPFHEAVALRGEGVEETLKTATGMVFKVLAAKYGSGADAKGKPVAPQPAAPQPEAPAPPRPAAPPPAPRPAPTTHTDPVLQASAATPPEPSADSLLDSLDGGASGELPELDLGEPEQELDLGQPESPAPDEALDFDQPAPGAEEELSFDEPLPEAEPASEPGDLQLEELSFEEPLPEAEPMPEPTPAPVPERRPTPSPKPVAPRGIDTIPVEAEVQADAAGAAETEVAVPIEVVVGERTTEVEVRLKLRIKLKR